MYVVPYSKREQPTMAVSVSDIANNLKSDPDISNLKLDGNVLTYTMFNTTDVKIVENIDEYGVCVLEITEGDKTDSLTFDTSNNKIMLNDDIIEVELVESYVFQKDTLLESNSTSSSWVYYGVIYPNLRAEQSIRNIPLAALTTLFLGSFGWKGTITGFVQSVISTLNSANNDTKSIYCIRNIYRTSDGYYLFKYYDALYADSSYNFHIKTRIWEQYE
ncbi:MAG: hypothetical protein PHY44_02970 [Lachnospiraceae bacterium]|nr:hypothetical protein [Lachnospiraceae bacterium]